MKNYGVFVFGCILMILGGLGLLANFGIIELTWSHIWPLFILVPGLMFELGYFFGGRKDPGLLIPGGILLTYGVLFYICVLDGFRWMSLLWPLFILGPAVGLFQFYLFGSRDSGLLIPVGILGGIGVIFLMMNFSRTEIGGLVFPILLIVLGTVIVVRTMRKNREL